MSIPVTDNFSVVQHGPKTIVTLLDQNVDFRNCETIKSTVRELASNGQIHLILNLERVSFMDSSGLGVMMFCKRICDGVGGTLALCSMQQYVDNLLTLTNLKKAMPVFATQEAALAG